MARDNKGAVREGKDGLFYGRVRWTDAETGEAGDKKFPPQATESAAWKLVHKFKESLDMGGTKAVDVTNVTFENLVHEYGESYLVEAEYVDGVKTKGLRSLATPKTQLKVLCEFFKKKRLSALTYADIRRFREARLKTSKRGGGRRSLASVNRELAMLRRMLNVAAKELRWIPRNPFQDGQPLISIASERKRERILTREEEARLLAACTGRRTHLRPIIVAAIDTGCRFGELLKMEWRDVDFAAGVITIRAFNTKTLRERQVSLTARLAQELETLP
jgi:integrase